MINKVNTAYYYRTILVLCDLVLVNLLLFLFYRIVPHVIPEPISYPGRLVFFVSTVSFLLAAWLVWRNWRQSLPTLRWTAVSTLKVAVGYCALCFVVLRIIYDAGEFFSFILIFLPCCYLLLLLANMVLLQVLRMRSTHQRVANTGVYVGSADIIRQVVNLIDANLQSTHVMRGYYADVPGPDTEEMPKYLGTTDRLLQRLQEQAQHEEGNNLQDVFCCTTLDGDNISALLRACDRALVRFHFVPFTKDNLLSSLSQERIGDTLIFTAHLHPIFYIENRWLKRAFDIVVSLLVCLCMLPFLPLVAWLIKRQSKGPVFFTQQRTGLDGKTFKCYKFRSMHINNESDTLQATKDDTRIFPFGRFMRKTNLDEFPQFFNVLRGDMSIVGPRPHMTKHTEQYSALVDKFMVRHFSKPGITGYAQVTGCRGETRQVSEMEERIRKDVYYIEHWTFWLDIKIILRTVKTIFVPDQKAY
ncbi:MAG: exopolysaccharide biosynthesis polyprenyl glycosylphosphotransferase [Bacteroidaceae bacterium]|nr:exopolysaccharide biosynthesis polyprenyl glycosylphosphotransferase [Bacteroidaceae bacterium]